MKTVYSYVMKSESGDMFHVISETNYDSPIEFMKNEASEEYEGWKDLGYEDDEIPYCDYDQIEYTVNL